MKRAVALYDIHYPLVHRPTLAALLDFLKREQVDIVVYGGDQHDNGEISHHNKNKAAFKPPGAFAKNTDGFRTEVLEPIEQAVGPDAEYVWIVGNHERFADDLIEEHPEYEGLFDRVALYRLRERGYKVIPLGHSYSHGKLSFIHGEWLTGVGNQAGAFPAKKLVEITATNTVAGHTHTAQSYTRISPVEQGDKWMGWISPILGTTNPAYLRNRPTSWLNGFTIVEYHDNDQTFNCYPIIVINGQFSYGGKTYGGQTTRAKSQGQVRSKKGKHIKASRRRNHTRRFGNGKRSKQVRAI